MAGRGIQHRWRPAAPPEGPNGGAVMADAIKRCASRCSRPFANNDNDAMSFSYEFTTLPPRALGLLV